MFFHVKPGWGIMSIKAKLGLSALRDFQSKAATRSRNNKLCAVYQQKQNDTF